MRAGELNRRITLQIKTITYDTVNEPIETWTDFATVWASIITTGGREFYAAKKLNAETSAVFKIRYNPMVNPRMRISWGNRIFEIVSVNDVDARHEELQISAKEVV